MKVGIAFHHLFHHSSSYAQLLSVKLSLIAFFQDASGFLKMLIANIFNITMY
jgi:hypothetical protein